MTRAHGAMLLLGFSLFIGSCSTDPTTSDEYLQLADEKSSVESDLAESLAATAAEAAALAAVETELAASQTELANSQTALGDSQTALSTAEASLDEARTSGADESTRADLAEANAEDLLGQNAELIARAEAISTALRRARELLSVQAVDVLSGEPEFIAELPADVLALRESLATSISWFAAAEDYNIFESFRAFSRASQALDDADVAAVLSAWDRFWDAEVGSDEELNALVEYVVRAFDATINFIDEALAAATLEE